MKKLTLFAFLATVLVLSALPASSQAVDAGTTVGDLFPAAEILGNDTLDFTQQAGGGSGCYYTCSCNGTPLRCCSNASGGVSCKATNVIQCPQVNNC